MFDIQEAVGSGGKNHTGDVIIVQELLNHHIAFGLLTDATPLKLTGKADAATIKTIRAFQERVVIQKPDGKVDRGGTTWHHLSQPPNTQKIRAEAIGLTALGRFFGPVGSIDTELWNRALASLLAHSGDKRLRSGRIVTLVDFRKSKNERRLWVVDLRTRSILHETWVCHGSGSGAGTVPTSFSNQSGTHKSCVGPFLTRHSWSSQLGGVNGRAMGLWGLEKTNSNAKNRGIHFHGASYVKPGSVGQSHGCFGTIPSVNETLVDLLQKGHFVFAWAGTSWI
jgi:hypothetical protein